MHGQHVLIGIGQTMLSVLVIALLIAASLSPIAVAEPNEYGAQGGDGLRSVLPADTLKFPTIGLLKNYLSGRMWLIASGLDPALSLVNDLKFVRPSLVEEGVKFTPARSPIFQGPGAAGALVPFRSPAPAFSRNILITRDLSALPFQTEPHIAVNPKDPDHIIVGVIDYSFPNVVAYVSRDGGASWEGPKQIRYLQIDLASGGDPTVAFDRSGKAYFAFISIGIDEYRIGPFVGEAVVSSIALSTSEDGGYTWSEPVSAARSGFIDRTKVMPDGKLRGEYVFTFLDKPWMTVGPDKQDPSKDAVYLTYTEFAVIWQLFYVGELVFFANPIMETTIKLVKSTDGGKTWTAPVSVSPTVRRLFGGDAGYAGGVSKRVLQGSQPAVAPDGTVYVAWLDSLDDGSMEGLAEIKIARSDDGGRTWSKPFTAATFREIGFQPRNARFRYWASAFPQLAVGPEGEVYIVFTARPFDKEMDDGDIYFVKSLDRGETWSRPKRINDDETTRLQFFPSITVDDEGVIHVMWGDTRDDPAEIKYHIYYTRSEDKGETWGFEIEQIAQRVGSTRVTDAYSNPNFGFPAGLFIGDYFSITSSSEDVYLVWADTRLGEFVGLNQKIGFARLRPIKSPELFISPPQGAGGRDVTIRGFNFQPESSVFIEVSGSIVAFAKTNEEGEFITKIFMPITGEGTHTVRVFDQSGNFAESSFYIDFGFDTVKEAQEELAEKLEAVSIGAGEQEQLARLANELVTIKRALEDLGYEGGRDLMGARLDLVTTLTTAAAGIAIGLAISLVISRVRRPKLTQAR